MRGQNLKFILTNKKSYDEIKNFFWHIKNDFLGKLRNRRTNFESCFNI